ncbi:branched-chain amino acid ABC transporter permease [Herbiconiux sp. KACC 21604]|uniref:branched-chain amino acid ABC transporter permease n=1 Tax=unclassified Herbiconiux TaxID=2618217 RepID=UPI001491CFF8|nr:branched-chain amino acid ABC transporter permease [Herbiconiux sp. SALV-R1]QJU55639.1 branched-chain amino acid ABC transporter permease [Herbiconiux sp. SALV-R1]WPO86837.1 branched-chain amino acid ABC transporter permease [Herbiconiux sp. KACC 21604]
MIDGGVIISGLLIGGLYAIVALGLSLVFGVMRLVNLAHGELIVMGAYGASLLVTVLGWDPLVSMLVVAPVVAAIAYPVQRYLLTGLLRRGLEPPLVATFGISLLVSSALVIAFSGNARSMPAAYALDGVQLFGQTVRVSDVIAFVIGVVLVVATHLAMTRTRFGTVLRAAAVDPATAGTMAIDVKHVYAITFAAAAGFAAVAGVLIGIGYSFTPSTGTSYILIGFTVVVLGGTGSVLGTLWGGLALGVIQSVGSAVVGGQYRDFVIYAAFIVILLLKPFTQRIGDTVKGARAEHLREKAVQG